MTTESYYQHTDDCFDTAVKRRLLRFPRYFSEFEGGCVKTTQPDRIREANMIQQGTTEEVARLYGLSMDTLLMMDYCTCRSR